jgi:hypothetical protein
MAIVTRLARIAGQIGYHRIASGDTATGLNDWLVAWGQAAPGPDGFVTDNEDGTFAVWDTTDGTYETGTVGDYIVLDGNGVTSPSDFASRFVVPVPVLGP